MKYIQVGEIGKAVLVSTKSDLPTAGIAYLNKFYVVTDTNIIYTCKPEGSGYAWKVVTVLPTLTNGIAAPTQLQEGIEAIDGYGNKVTGTMKLVEKTANANGSTKIVVTVDPSKETNATENGTAASTAVSNAAKNSAAASSVKTVSSAANPITASSSAVIKATGDNTAVVFAVAALAVAGVLGMAVRKERAL